MAVVLLELLDGLKNCEYIIGFRCFPFNRDINFVVMMKSKFNVRMAFKHIFSVLCSNELP